MISALDDLTGAYRRGSGLVELEREMGRARRTGQPLTVAFVDVDNLKATNDERGHAGGDRLLCEVVGALRTRLRSYDLIVRYGGDEFVCVIGGLNVGKVTERLALVNPALMLADGHGSVTMGFAELLPTETAAELIGRADHELYRERRRKRVSTST